MPDEKDLERHVNKMVFLKIIKTENLTEKKCNEYLAHIKTHKPYSEELDINFEKYWRGFTQKYVYSYKMKQKQKNKKKLSYKDFDKGFKKIEISIDQQKIESNVIKTTYVYKDNINAPERYIDTFLMPELDFICIIGSKESNDPSKTEITAFLDKEKIKYQEININHDFLLWGLWKLSMDSEIHPSLYMTSFDKLGVGPKYSGKRVDHDEMTPPVINTIGEVNTYPSAPICFGLFNSRVLNGFKGEFKYNDTDFQSDIFIKKIKKTTESIIHVRWGEDKKSIHYSKKLKLVLPFIYTLSESIIKWNKLSESDQLPDEKYLDDLWDRYKDDFDETKINFDSYKKKFCKKKNIECKNKTWEKED
jgi:hypothetical protein